MFGKIKKFFGTASKVTPEEAFVRLMQIMGEDENIQNLVNKIIAVPSVDRSALINSFKAKGMPDELFAIIQFLQDDMFCKKIISVQINRS